VQLLVESVLEKLQKRLNEDLLKILTNQKEHEVLEVLISFEILQGLADDVEDIDEDRHQ